MLQDIPKSLDIEYDSAPAQPHDTVLCFDGRKVLSRIQDNIHDNDNFFLRKIICD